MKTLTVKEAEGHLAELIAEAHRGEIVVLTDGERQVWLGAEKPLDLETDNPALEAEILKSIEGPFELYSSEALRGRGQRIIDENRSK